MVAGGSDGLADESLGDDVVGRLARRLRQMSREVSEWEAALRAEIAALPDRDRPGPRRHDRGAAAVTRVDLGPPGRTSLSREGIERPDVAKCETHDAVVCSLCLSQDKVGDHVLPAA